MKIPSLLAGRKEDNLYKVSSFLLKRLDVNFTKLGLSKSLESHVDYPSILSLKDTISNYGVESAAVRKGEYSYCDFETPFICSIQKEGWSSSNFTIVTKAELDGIEYLDSLSNSLQEISLEAFEKIDKNIILLMETSSAKDETNLEINRKVERAGSMSKRVPLYLMLFALFASIAFSFSSPFDMYSGLGIAYILTSFVGFMVSGLLLWHEVDAHNPFIKEVCGGNTKKMNCNAVLSSSKASFLGLSWSIWGFSFFATFLSTQLFNPANPSFLLLWSIINLLIAPYILFSLYYQWKIVRQWCPLCIVIQFVLGVNAILATSYLLIQPIVVSNVPPYSILSILLAGAIFLFITYTAIPIIKRANDSKSYEKKWKNLRFNREIFGALLDKSETVNFSADNLGIVIGNPTASNEIIKVCNPYCGPCSKAHPELEHILKSNNDVKIRIIFTASGKDDDLKTHPVAHLLAIEEYSGPEKIHQALDYWYMAPNKDYEAFAKKYPMNGELKLQTEKIHAMRDWCNDMKIRATPTIYINGKELPDSYNIVDLKSFF